MEIIIVLVAVVIVAAVWVANKSKPKTTTHPIDALVAETAPGKSADDRVEATAPKCGCGRSPTGFCVGLHKLTAEEWAVSDQNPNKVADTKPAVKKAPAKKTAAKKPAVKKAPAKKKST